MPTLAADQKLCKDLLPEVSRTFTLSIELLPESMREPVRVAYLLCRIVDTIEDEADLPIAQRRALYLAFDQCLTDDAQAPDELEALARAANLMPGKPDGRLCANAGAPLRVFRSFSSRVREAMRPHVLEMSRGMQIYSERAHEEGQLRLRDLDDLEKYCYYVAGTVGELLTDLFFEECPIAESQQRAALRTREVPFGLGLQMVNIVKDVATDLERGDCFLPVKEAKAQGLNLDDLNTLLEPEGRFAALDLLDIVIERAQKHLDAAREYTLLWPADGGAEIRLFCAVPLAMATASLREVKKGDDTLKRGRTPKISRGEVFAILAQAKSAVKSDRALEQLFERFS